MVGICYIWQLWGFCLYIAIMGHWLAYVIFSVEEVWEWGAWNHTVPLYMHVYIDHTETFKLFVRSLHNWLFIFAVGGDNKSASLWPTLVLSLTWYSNLYYWWKPSELVASFGTVVSSLFIKTCIGLNLESWYKTYADESPP